MNFKQKHTKGYSNPKLNHHACLPTKKNPAPGAALPLQFTTTTMTTTRQNTVFKTHIQDVSVGLALVRVLEVGVAYEDGVHVGAGVLVELAVAGYHDNSDLHIT